MTRAAKPRMTFAEYVRFEAESDVKHELVDGEVFAMAGGTLEHAALAAAVIGELRTALAGKPCVVFTSDARVRVPATGLVTYPDVSVICGPIERDREDDHTATNPTVIVEVLSDSTEAYDRGQKFAHYRRLPSLRAYVLVSQHEPRIEVYRRTGEHAWTLEEAEPPADATIEAIGCALSVERVYAGIPRRAPAPPPGSAS